MTIRTSQVQLTRHNSPFIPMPQGMQGFTPSV